MVRPASELHGVVPGRYGMSRATPDRSAMAQLARQTVAIVLAGGRGARLGPLTESRAKPAVPFGGKFRIIDFSLSNCLNSGIRRICIATQYQSHSLIHHLQRGWSFLDGRFNEFIELLPAQQSSTSDDWYKLASGKGTSSAPASTSGNSGPVSAMQRRAVASLAGVGSTPTGRAPSLARRA